MLEEKGGMYCVEIIHTRTLISYFVRFVCYATRPVLLCAAAMAMIYIVLFFYGYFSLLSCARYLFLKYCCKKKTLNNFFWCEKLAGFCFLIFTPMIFRGRRFNNSEFDRTFWFCKKTLNILLWFYSNPQVPKERGI
jgi:hypothetical protein